MKLQPFSFAGVKDKYDAKTHRLSRFQSQISKRPQNPFFSTGNEKAGVKGHAIINGEYVETTRVLMQRQTPMGVAYYPYGKPKVPIFIRAIKGEQNKKYVVFQDPYLPPGEGFLVVLKKIPIKINFEGQRLIDAGTMPSGMLPVPQEVPYDAFHLHLSNNIQGTFDRLNVRKFAYGIRTKFASRSKARQEWERQRLLKSQTRRRFGVARWRGKRSTSTQSRNPKNLTRAHKKDYLNLCYISQLNITAVRLQVENITENPVNFAKEINSDIGFDYIHQTFVRW